MDSELQALLNTIMWGRRYASIEDARGNLQTCVIKDLELEDRVWIDFIYKQAIADGKQRGLISSGELAIFLDEAGVWTKKDDKEIQNLKISIHKMNEVLDNDEVSKRERQVTKKMRESAQAALNKKENEKSHHFTNSAETYASSERLNASIYCSLYLDETTRYWKTWRDFQLETDSIFIRNATIQIFRQSNITVSKIRKIARSPNWRFRWNAYKQSGNLFSKPLSNLTQDQDSLVYWSQVYDAAYDSLDRPEESTINNDKELDEWFENQAKKRKKKEAESGKGKVGRTGSSKIWKHSEVGIVVNPAAAADIKRAEKLGLAKNLKLPTVQEVSDMNSPLSKKLLAHEKKKLKKHGVLEERDLRSDSNSRRAISSTDVVFKKAKRRDGYTGKQVIDKKPGGTIQGRRE